MQQTIAQQLGLTVGTVSNFFMNARRRSVDKWMLDDDDDDDDDLFKSSPANAEDDSNIDVGTNHSSTTLTAAATASLQTAASATLSAHAASRRVLKKARAARSRQQQLQQNKMLATTATSTMVTVTHPPTVARLPVVVTSCKDLPTTTIIGDNLSDSEHEAEMTARANSYLTNDDSLDSEDHQAVIVQRLQPLQPMMPCHSDDQQQHTLTVPKSSPAPSSRSRKSSKAMYSLSSSTAVSAQKPMPIGNGTSNVVLNNATSADNNNNKNSSSGNKNTKNNLIRNDAPRSKQYEALLARLDATIASVVAMKYEPLNSASRTDPKKSVSASAGVVLRKS